MIKAKRVSIGLSDQEYNDLQMLASKHGVSLAWIGRKAILDILAAYRDTDHSPVLQFRKAQKDKN